DAPADRRRVVRAVDRELVAARPSRGQPRLDPADAERARSERAPRTERRAIRHHGAARPRGGPGGARRGRPVVPELAVRIHAGGRRRATVPAPGTWTRSCGPAGIAGAAGAGWTACAARVAFASAGWRRCAGGSGRATVRGGYG